MSGTWNRNLDQIEAKTLFELKENGYKAVDKKHIIHFREIYDFICRFADPAYVSSDEKVGIRLRMDTGQTIPPKTREIIYEIGIENLHKYFSMDALPKTFYWFCEKLIRTKRIVSTDYIAEGTIVPEYYPIETREYRG